MSHNDWQSVRFLLRRDEFLMQDSFPLEHVQSLLTGKTPELGPNNSPETEQSRKHGVVQKQPATDKNAAEDEQTTNMSASCLTLKYIKTRVLLSRSQNQQSDGTKIIVSSSKSC